MQSSFVVPKARFLIGASEKGVRRRLAWLAIASACCQWTAPASAQSSPGNGLPRPAVEFLLTCRGYFEGFPKVGNAKADELTDTNHKILVMMTDDPAFRKQIENNNISNKEILEKISLGRKIVRSGDKQARTQWYDNCVNTIEETLGESGK